jgi:GTP pyrophosphokinase
MVAVRKSHKVVSINFHHWLEEQNLAEEKNQQLTALWQKINRFFDKKSLCLVKSMEMVEILAVLNLDIDSLVAAFLIPLIDEGIIDVEYIATHFSKNVVQLCQGVMQMAAIKELRQKQNQLHNSESKEHSSVNIDNVRKMLLTMVDDVRAVVIKLAERLCDLRGQKDNDEESRVLAAKESAQIYAPLANRLGIGQLKWELEDISFRYLHPDVYKKIAKLLDETRLERESYMVDFVTTLEQSLKDLSIEGKVFGRPKHIYSIWKKMQQKSLDFEELFDVRAVRIIVDKVQNCYSALGIVHTQWRHLANEFSDYVATPKPNGYQSIHTVVSGPNGKSIEIQIRTQKMDEDAELGVAAHWRYKEGNAKAGDKKNGFDDKIEWLRKILQWQDDVAQSSEIIDELRSQVFDDRIYVFTPGGDVVDLPLGSTPLDFAYYIHSNVGHCCIGAKVFGKIVPFTRVLETGDQVEILTSKQPNPSKDWLNPQLGYIHSARARAKVQHFFKLQDRGKHISQGKDLLESELLKQDIQQVGNTHLKEATERFNVKSIEDLYAAIGSGNARLQQVVNFINQLENKHRVVEDVDPQSIVKQDTHSKRMASDSNGVTVSGVGNLLTHMAKCCSAVPGDEIAGFITQGRGISVHQQGCDQLQASLNSQPERLVEVQWGLNQKQSYQASVQLIANDRQGLFRDISTIIANERISIVGIDSHTDNAKQTVVMNIKLEVNNSELLMRVLDKLRQLNDIAEVNRL